MSLLAQCPICGNAKLEIYVERKNKSINACMVGSSRTTAMTGRIVRCRPCRFGFQESPPSEADLVHLYHEMDTRVYETEARGRAKTAAAHLSLVQTYTKGQGSIDVGGASGLFLRCALEAGWQVTGVEVSHQLCEKAREVLSPNATVHCSPLQSAPLPRASFDVITLWDVLEHVRNPIQFLKLCASLLKPTGYLFANVPNLDSVQSRLFRSRWPLLLPEHLNYFTPHSLRLCGNQAALQWVGYGKRPVAFSWDYILYRLGQHRIPGALQARNLARQLKLDTHVISLYLGEICGVWRMNESGWRKEPALDVMN